MRRACCPADWFRLTAVRWPESSVLQGTLAHTRAGHPMATGCFSVPTTRHPAFTSGASTKYVAVDINSNGTERIPAQNVYVVHPGELVAELFELNSGLHI